MSTPTPAVRVRSRTRIGLYYTTLIFVSCLFVLLALEVAIRIRRGKLTSLDKIGWDATIPLTSMMPVDYDSELGYIPRARSQTQGIMFERASVDDDGLRSNGHSELPPGPPILAVGDSCTWGSNVDDDQTWPAYLEQALSRRVLNAGVGGYGVDQIVGRAERLVPRHHPAALVVTIIANDIDRCELSCRDGRWRPYYTVEAALRPHNVPVNRDPPPPTPVTPLRTLLRYSHLADALLSRVASAWWMRGQGSIQAHHDGVAVAVLLMDRLGRLQQQSGVPVLLVMEMAAGSELPRARPVIARARERGLQVLDLSAEVHDLTRRSAGTPDPFARGHLTPRGNRWVAQRIAAQIRRMGVVPAVAVKDAAS